MTPKQKAWYWREWQAVRKACPDADRHALHTAALGRDKSSKLFTNRDLDQVIAQFRSISDPNGLNAQLRQLDQPRTRLVYSIQEYARACVALPPGKHSPDQEPIGWNSPRPSAALRYLTVVMESKFGTTDLDALTDAQLVMLQHTLAARASAKSKSQRRSAHPLPKGEGRGEGKEPVQTTVDCPF
jgi:hypothetical protein